MYTMKRLGFLICCAFLFTEENFAQRIHETPALIIGSDTIPVMNLGKVFVIRRKSLSGEQRRLRKLNRDVKKVYPYAVRAGRILVEIHIAIDSLERRRDERRYLRELDRRLKAEFKEELMNLTVTQGKLLVLLLDRETGYSCHAIVKDLKGGINAFFWHNVGRLFGYNLKKGYSAKEYPDIEAIVQRLERT